MRVRADTHTRMWFRWALLFRMPSQFTENSIGCKINSQANENEVKYSQSRATIPAHYSNTHADAKYMKLNY